MRPEAIVDLSPSLHKHFRLIQRIQHFSVQKLVPHLADERLHIAVLPGAPGLDKQRRHVKPVQPPADRLSREFRAIVGSNVFRDSSGQEQLIELVQNIPGPDPPGHMERKALPGVLVDDGQDLQGPAVGRPLHHHVVSL